MTTLVKIQVNGELREFSDGLTVETLISTLGLEPTRVAIELNQNVVRRNDWRATVLQPEDRVEIVHFVGGGAVDQLSVANTSYPNSIGVQFALHTIIRRK